MMILRNNIDEAAWNKFVINHPNKSIFQSPYYYNVIKKTKNAVPKVFICIENEKIVGVLVSVIFKEGYGIKGFLTSRSIIIGGPLVLDNRVEVAYFLLNEYLKEVKKRAIYSQIRNVFNVTAIEKSFLSLKFKYIPHLDIHIDLTIDIDEFWKQLKPKLRQNIRKAEKNGVVVEFATKNDVKEIYGILKNVYSKAKLPLPDISLFNQAFSQLYDNNILRPFIAVWDNKIIGCRLVMTYGDVIYDWFAGSLDEYKKLNPNDLLPYKVIEWGIKHSEYKLFDFGGAGKPNVSYGVRDYKLKFWNHLIEFGRYEKVHFPIIYNLVKFIFCLWRRISL